MGVRSSELRAVGSWSAGRTLFLGVFVACQPKHPASPPRESNTPGAQSRSTPVANPTVSPPQSDGGVPRADPAITSVSASEARPTPPECRVVYRHEEYFPRSASIDVKAWRHAHHVTRGFAEATCWNAGDRVGVPGSPGLFCEASYRSPARTLSRLYRLESGALRLVWQGLVATWTNWTEVTPLLAEDGSTLRLVERTPYACAGAYRESREKLAAGVQPGWLHAELEEACRALGTYAWDGSRYTRTDAPTLESSCNPSSEL